MAFMSQDRKRELAPAIKAICKKYGIKATLGVHHHSTLVLNVKSGPIDFISDYYEVNTPQYRARFGCDPERSTYIQVNPYWAHEQHSGKAKAFLVEVLRLMNIGNYDKSDIQSDYFCVGWYVNVNIGKWNKPYQVVK